MIQRVIRKLNSILFPPDHSPLRKGKNGTFIFVHINKTGGTSIAKAIGLPIKNHLTIQEVIQEVGAEAVDNAYVFAVVRNPWSKVVSHYKYRVKTNQTDMQTNPISFKDWVKATYSEQKDTFYYDIPKMFAPQVEWMKDAEGKMCVDKVINFENLNEGFREVALKIGVNPELPHLNATKKEPYTKYYDDETREIIAKWFAEDIELFGYEYGK